LFYQESHVTLKTGDLRIVAFEDETLVGGVTCDLYGDTMYVSWLVVDEHYRGRHIGKTLMKMVEQEAINRHFSVIELGTCEFQAKDFYEKLRYDIMMTRENYPKGYRSYSMAKHL
jgi:ribosomal protein S18 acetylase RimI-like enzyme